MSTVVQRIMVKMLAVDFQSSLTILSKKDKNLNLASIRIKRYKLKYNKCLILISSKHGKI